MKKEDIDRLAASHNCIPGIFNYCDRWCERCALTSRCLSYLMAEEHFGPDTEACDLTNEIFWQNLADMFKLTIEMIRETAEEMGVDLDAIADGPETGSREPDDEGTVTHVVEHLAKSYAGRADDWFETGCRSLEDRMNNPPLQLADYNEQQQAVDAADALAIIRWYQHQIYVKIRRALNSFAERDDGPNDADGSAKVALIGIDRSISAWGVLLKLFPESSEGVLPLVTMLENLRKRLEAEFPQARDFMRPGFDSV